MPIAPRDRLGRRTAAAFGILLLVFAASTAAMAAIPGNDGSGGSWEDTR